MRRLPDLFRRLPRSVRVRAAVEKLEPRQRIALSLLLLERLTPVEAAGAMRTSVRQVEMLFDTAVESILRDSGTRRSAAQLRKVA